MSHNEHYKAGDIVAWSGLNVTSGFINLVTRGLPIVSVSHVGVMAEVAGKLLHFESTTLSDLPCAIQGKCVRGMQAVRLADRLNTYKGRAWHYPLVRPLFPDQSERLSAWLLARIGLPYDTPNAMRSADILGFWRLAHLRRLWRMARYGRKRQHEYFCSEADAGALCACGVFDTDDPEQFSPTRLIRYLRRQEKILPGRRLSLAH